MEISDMERILGFRLSTARIDGDGHPEPDVSLTLIINEPTMMVTTLLENGPWALAEKGQRHRFPNRCPATIYIISSNFGDRMTTQSM